MPLIDQNRIKGNYGEHLVAQALSKYGCLVRPVAEGTDIGVDLYCETVEEDQPFLHFWVQVKARKDIKITEDNKIASFPFQVDHLRYWDRQPVPVFAFLIKIEDSLQPPENIYIAVLSSIYHPEIQKTVHESLTIRSQYKFENNTDEFWKEFLFKIMPMITSEIRFKDGTIGPIPTLTPKYKKYIPDVPGCSQYAYKVKKSILISACTIVSDAAFSIKNNEKDYKKDYEILTLVKILKTFTTLDSTDYLVQQSLSFWERVTGNIQQANKYHKKAKETVKNDPNLSESNKIEFLKGIEIRWDDIIK